MGTKKKTVKKKGKKIRKGRKHESLKVSKFYALEGNKLVRKKKSCPRCGAGTWLAEHKGRSYCGRCGYTIFEGKVAKPVAEKEEPMEKTEPKKEESKEQKAEEK